MEALLRGGDVARAVLGRDGGVVGPCAQPRSQPMELRRLVSAFLMLPAKGDVLASECSACCART